MSSNIVHTDQVPDESIPLEGELCLLVYRASTHKPDHAVFRVCDSEGTEQSPVLSVLSRAVVRLNNECHEAWHVAAQNESNAGEMISRERDRIRTELINWLVGYIDPRTPGLINGRRITDEIDRICLKE